MCKSLQSKKYVCTLCRLFCKKSRKWKILIICSKKILESKDFYEYVKEHGTPTTTKFYRISVKEIENYRFDLENYR